MEPLQIDLKKVIRQKNVILSKIPFFVSWLRKFVHEAEINEFLRNYGHLHGMDFIAKVIEYFNLTIEKVVKNNSLDPHGRYLFVANHPLGGLDGVSFIQAISDIYGDVRFPVNDILLTIENFQPLLLPINKYGKQDRESAKKINEAFASSDKQILMFPAGLVSRKIKGKIVDLEWQKHFISKAIDYRRDVVPVYIIGQNSKRFYKISSCTRALRLPPLEMLSLPDEVFLQKNKTIKIIIGDPISYKMFNKNAAQVWADCVKNKVYQLA